MDEFSEETNMRITSLNVQKVLGGKSKQQVEGKNKIKETERGNKQTSNEVRRKTNKKKLVQMGLSWPIQPSRNKGDRIVPFKINPDMYVGNVAEMIDQDDSETGKNRILFFL
jgi:hypothetical protein